MRQSQGKGARVTRGVNGQDAAGNSSLHFATMNKALKIVKLLDDHGADPALQNRGGLSPIDIAIQAQANEVLKYYTR